MHQQNFSIGKKQIELQERSLISYRADALVCPLYACEELSSIYTEGGPSISAELRRITEKNKKPDGFAHLNIALTNAGALPVRYIIHVVCGELNLRGDKINQDATTIAKAMKRILELAKQENLQSFGMTPLGATDIMFPVTLEDSVNTIVDSLRIGFQEETPLERVGLIVSVDKYMQSLAILQQKLC